jgi:tRNA nucleotidyltransferase (CCA-adding enzyme)
MAKSQSETVKHQVSAYLNVYQRTQPFLTGKALKAMGLTPGPQFGRILDRLLRARLDGEVRSEADERELVKRLAERPDPDCQA